MRSRWAGSRCVTSGGVAGKYTFGARTAGANTTLGLGYVLLAVFAVELVTAHPVAVLGVLRNLGVAFVAGIIATRIRR